MNSRPVIYVNRITSLSDARYCAGMGADLLGFVVTPGHPDYVSPLQFKEIMGWVSGPRRVVEIVGGEPVNVEDVIAQYAPDLLHLAVSGRDLDGLASFPMILEIPFVNWSPQLQNDIEHTQARIEYLFLSGAKPKSGTIIAQDNIMPILLPISNSEKFIQKIHHTNVAGFVLQGSQELKPGLKDYDNLSTILEALDLI